MHLNILVLTVGIVKSHYHSYNDVHEIHKNPHINNYHGLDNKYLPNEFLHYTNSHDDSNYKDISYGYYEDIHNNDLTNDALLPAFKDHAIKCGTNGHIDNHYSLMGLTDRSTYGTKDLYAEYDKYGFPTGKPGLINENGYVAKGALNRILSSSLESGLNIKDSEVNGRIASYKGYEAFPNLPLGVSQGKSISGYRSKRNENLLESDNPAILGNIKCSYPSNGYGHVYCSDDKIVGEHYDLSHWKGPFRVNAHFETPSKVSQPPHHNAYHPNQYKDILMAKRTGVSSNDILRNQIHKTLKKDCKNGHYSENDSHHHGGCKKDQMPERFITPSDEFHYR